MQFNVARLLQGPVGTSQVHTLDAAFALLKDTQTDRVWGRAQITGVIEGVWVNASLEATVTYACSRCLQDFLLGVRFQLDEIYSSVMDVFTGASLPLPEDADPNFTIDSHHVVDITEGVRQSTILALPMKPLCRDDCAGICPDCGVNRNEAHCNCQGRDMDPRWAPLLNGSSLGIGRQE